MIKIATAECFTHGKIGREIHALAQDYEGNFGRDYIENPLEYGDFDYKTLSVNCSLFIPTIEAVQTILQVENPPEPKELIKGIKVYNEKQDLEVSKIMAEAVKKLTGCDIAIGTTAGIGRGGITIISDDFEISTTSDINADLRENNSENLFLRQESGIDKTLKILLLALNEKFSEIEKIENTKLILK
ncbi:MAG: UPF0254 family protein [Methanobrevibacter sp.]|uniref:UPF0254 family protein n=1 Tax=Methanobrevibacter sp. TaxID=66852 RepID=UPI0026DF8BDE|nr:UPF0254 family protein [Methanobrevibacter sp.]MDO5848406.1 UPF0254 family protein [Methanobrevibacter sp.]